MPEKCKPKNNGNKQLRMTKTIGQTTYKVNIHFSETSRETVGDKLIRLTKNKAFNT